MKKLLFTLILLSVFNCKTETQPASILTKFDVVKDNTQLFTKTESDSLSAKILRYEKETTREICIYTIDSLPKNESIMYYAKNIANRLGVGKADKDNGVCFLIAKHNREIALATGLGTEKIITDSIANKIIQDAIIPHFKNDNYYKGLNAGLDALFVKWSD